jgi:hypothetical protein
MIKRAIEHSIARKAQNEDQDSDHPKIIRQFDRTLCVSASFKLRWQRSRDVHKVVAQHDAIVRDEDDGVVEDQLQIVWRPR